MPAAVWTILADGSRFERDWLHALTLTHQMKTHSLTWCCSRHCSRSQFEIQHLRAVRNELQVTEFRDPALSYVPMHRAFLLLAALTSASLQVTVLAQSESPPRRIEDLIGQLTLGEKIDLISGGSLLATAPLPRLGIPAFRMTDGPVGVRHPPATAYAAGIALAASWDPALARDIGTQLGRDARARGVHFLLGPGVNLYRAPMNGRNFEYFGEDPWLAQRLTVPYIEGVQSQGVAATVKHFVGNESEYARTTSDSVIDERTLRELYLPAFEAAVKEAHVAAVMDAYNLVNGEHMTQNRRLNVEVLKQQWHFDGLLMSDWDATHDGVAAANAGLDLEMPVGRFMVPEALEPALARGELTLPTLDDKLRRYFRVAQRFGWLDRPQRDVSIPLYNQPGREVAYRGALESQVLLKNRAGLLPLDRTRVKTIAVIGPNAHPAVPTAGGSAQVLAFETRSVLQGLSDKLGGQATVTYAAGVPTLKALSAQTHFHTAEGAPGITVETFEDEHLAGKPRARRIEPLFTRGSPINLADPDTFAALENLSAEELAATFGRTEPTRERWTGWYTPDAAGTHTVFVQDAAGYRLLLDDRLIIDSSRVAKASLTQVRLTLDVRPHKVVFEQTGTGGIGPPFWRVGIVHDGTLVDPLARELAARADAVILAVGWNAELEGEAADREFALPTGQDELIRVLAAVNPNTIVVLNSGGAADVTPWLDDIGALIAVWYPGEQGGRALADVLFGDATPSGRLPISWERSPADNPSFGNYYYNDAARPNAIVYREGVFAGYRGYQRSGTQPLFPFGYGLSYTSFRYDGLHVQPLAATGRAPALFKIGFDVTNTGARAGAEVAQLYLGEDHARVARPPRELKGFARVELQPGETRHVELTLNARAFAYYDTQTARWHADAGPYTLEVARSAQAPQLRTTLRLAHPLEIGSGD
jgi:beta-glucosidase